METVESLESIGSELPPTPRDDSEFCIYCNITLGRLTCEDGLLCLDCVKDYLDIFGWPSLI